MYPTETTFTTDDGITVIVTEFPSGHQYTHEVEVSHPRTNIRPHTLTTGGAADAEKLQISLLEEIRGAINALPRR